MHKKCKLCGIEIQNKHSVSLHNRIFCSRKCSGLARRNKPFTESWRQNLSNGRKTSAKCKGENLYNWKGGKETLAERMRSHRHKRNSQINLPIDQKFIKALRIAQRNLCFYCEEPLSEFSAIEHLTPVSAGGDNHNFNIVWCCRPCNSKKRSKTLEHFAAFTGNLHWPDKWEHIYSEALIIYERSSANSISKAFRALTARNEPAQD